jgi:hypothetical protein
VHVRLAIISVEATPQIALALNVATMAVRMPATATVSFVITLAVSTLQIATVKNAECTGD